MPKAKLLEKGLLYQTAVVEEEVTIGSVTTRVLCIYEGSFTSSDGTTTKYSPTLIDKMATASNDYLDKGNRIPLFDSNHDENGYSRKDQIGLVTGPFSTAEITEELLPHPGMSDELLGKYALFSNVEIIGEENVQAYQQKLIKNISIALYLSKGGAFPQYVIYEISCVVWGAVFGASLYSLGVDGLVTLALVLPQDVASKVHVEGGYPPEELHLPLAELPSSEVEDIEVFTENIQKFASDNPPVTGSIGGVGRLTGRASDFLYLDFASPQLHNFASSLSEVTEVTPAVCSKIAIASLEPTKLTPLFRVEPIEVTFEALTLTVGQSRSDFAFKSQSYTDKVTDFPTKGDNKKISLKNSQYPQFDYSYAKNILENSPDIWKKGGNVRGNQAFEYWGKARSGDDSEGTLDWIKEREAWAARHFKDNRLPGVVAQMKWGVIGTLGEGGMKELINEEKKKVSKNKTQGKNQYAFTLEGQLRLEDKEWEYDPDDYEKVKLWIAFSRVMDEIDNATPEELPETEISLKEKAIASLVDKLRQLYELDPQGEQAMSGTPTPDQSETPSQYLHDMEAKYSQLEKEKNELAAKVDALEKHKELTASYNAHRDRARTLLEAGKMTPAQYNELFEPTEGKDAVQTYAAMGSDRVGFLLDQIEKHAPPLVKFNSALDNEPLPQRNGQAGDDVDSYLERRGKSNAS